MNCRDVHAFARVSMLTLSMLSFSSFQGSLFAQAPDQMKEIVRGEDRHGARFYNP